MSNILIVHSDDKDSEEMAERLLSRLTECGFSGKTYRQASETAPLGAPIITYHADLVEQASSVIVIASKKFFTDGFLVQIAEMAIFTKKFIPIIHETSLKLPLWFSMYTAVDFSRGISEIEWQRLLKDVR